VTSPEQFHALRATPDVAAPDALFDALRALPPEQCASAGMERAAETVERLRGIEGVDGVLVYPFGMTRDDMIALAREAGLGPRG
jgi:hypothetical protein